MVKISNKPITEQCMQRISNTGFSTRIRTINTIVLTNAVLHISSQCVENIASILTSTGR